MNSLYTIGINFFIDKLIGIKRIGEESFKESLNEELGGGGC